MTETQSAQDGTGGPRIANERHVAPSPAPAVADLRRTGINPDFWYPVSVSGSVRKNSTFAATFAGERIALYRGGSGAVYALEDRCAHRQVPLSMGVVEGESLRCCYHAWAYRGNGRISQIPYLPKGVDRPPRGVRAYPVREAYGLVFVFPGDPEKAAGTPLPDLPAFASSEHRTMTFSRTVQCHYSFMHENLLDMNHQFLHRGVIGRIRPELLGYDTGPHSVEARYLFTPAGGRKDRGAGLLSAEGIGGGGSPDVITIRTDYPYQTLQALPEKAELPAFSLWVAYVPEDAEQRTNHVYGLLMIRKPSVPGALRLAWPLIRRFTERVFAEDRMAVESEQRAWDEQGSDWNQEVFPLILDVRKVLRSNGVPIRRRADLCAASTLCGNATQTGGAPRAADENGTETVAEADADEKRPE
ncbi:aromatic ring-hydroxylating dioxygenase subunit alpha [Streptomyces sp. IB2014 016-6]|uniref:aromatic ring-hydroxylating oxygenase subunit alpha n=1 Tax=Streptomyces sp. IB2014 016-6 TaxID=2517818 RepID=UPI0011CAF2EC|nr:aromatic ring-hydroxylating dioxygenase subunit alpha [Streptomyces sp. IB2014 016-6]TXL89648.1 aromatic ring-hydroxylating dioxygenase subunit alpha [Streptomyces sp. IB2014 016-6]